MVPKKLKTRTNFAAEFPINPECIVAKKTSEISSEKASEIKFVQILRLLNKNQSLNRNFGISEFSHDLLSSNPPPFNNQ